MCQIESSENPAAPTPGLPAAPTVRLGEVCRLAGERQLSLSAAERLARQGPYPLYAENCSVSYIDEYALEEGGTVLVPAIGQVVSNEGVLCAVYEPGRCAATEHVHALVPHDPADGRYLWRVLSTSPRASRMVTGTSQVRQIGGPSLLATAVPWPDARRRAAFVEALDACDRRRGELGRAVPDLLAEGDAAFARIVAASTDETVAAGEVAAWRRGTNVAAADRAPDKPVRVEGPQGCLGRCDEALTAGPAVAVGPAGRRLLAHWVDGLAHPIDEMRFAEQADAQVPLAVLLFALRAAGVLDRLFADGRRLDAPQLAVDDLAGLALRVGTPQARAEFAPVGEDVLARVARAQRDAEQLEVDRRALIAAFFATGDVAGCADGAPVQRGALPVPRGVSYTFERARTQAAAQVAAREQAAAPGLALTAGQRAALGPLAALVEADAFGLAPADVAWELGPLACVRACAAPGDWQAVADAAAAGGAGLVEALDAAMDALAQEDDLLAFLPNLSYGTSLLAPGQLAAWVRALDGVPAGALRGAHVRAAFALDAAAPGMPAAVASVIEQVVEAVAAGLPAGFEAGYVPREACEGMVDVLGRVLPGVTLRVQFDEFAEALQAAMVRAVELAGARETRGGLGAAPGCALTADEFADWTAPLVLAALPPNDGPWTAAPVPADDPRWVLGTPPRSRAHYAWLQQALSHQEPGGATVLLAGNHLLHASAGSEAGLRAALAASGRVRLVAALPARVFADGRPAASLLVLGDPDPDGRCLMVDALGLGVPNPDVPAELLVGDARPAGVAERVLPRQAADRVVAACRAWLERGAVDEEPGFARAVGVAELAACGNLLTPWTYVRRDG